MPKFDARTSRVSRRAIPGEYVVKLVPEACERPGVLREILGELPIKISLASPLDRFGMAVVRVDDSVDPSDLVDHLRRHPAIEFVEPNFIDSGS